MDFKQILCEYGMSQSKCSRELGIPLRTVQSWCIGEREPPEWAVRLIVFYLDHQDDNSPKK